MARSAFDACTFAKLLAKNLDASYEYFPHEVNFKHVITCQRAFEDEELGKIAKDIIHSVDPRRETVFQFSVRDLNGMYVGKNGEEIYFVLTNSTKDGVKHVKISEY